MVYGDEDIDAEKILIVDDVEVNREVLGEIIKNMGYCPVLAENGEKALEIIEESRPGLVLTDISMPGMDGYGLCKILKEKEETREIPVVFISAFDNPKDIIEGFTLGGEDYITKPFIPEIVEARVGVRLRLYEASRDLKQLNRKLQISVNEQLKQMEEEKENILYALANIVSQNDSYEEEHRKRLGTNCKILAQGMQLSPAFEGMISDTYIDTIELAAPLCDIGNIGVPREILQKKEELTKEEIAIKQSHTSIGAKFLRDLYANSDYNDFISILIDIVYHHHENWNGSGYPEQLKADDIPLSAQIVSVMQEYCTLTEKNFSREEALEIMDKESGIKFNPDIYKICSKISRQLC